MNVTDVFILNCRQAINNKTSGVEKMLDDKKLGVET